MTRRIRWFPPYSTRADRLAESAVLFATVGSAILCVFTVWAFVPVALLMVAGESLRRGRLARRNSLEPPSVLPGTSSP